MPEVPFLAINDGEFATYREVHERSWATSTVLQAVGVQPGNYVVSLLPTRPEAVHVWLATAMIGAVDAPINPALRGAPLVHVLNLMRASCLVADSTTLPQVLAAEDELHSLTTVLLAPSEQEVTLPPASRLKLLPLLTSTGLSQSAVPLLVRPPAYSDIGTVLFTSGTTGPSKGVLMPHAMSYASARTFIEGIRLTASDTYHSVHPLFHMAGRMGALYGSLLAGSRLVLDSRFDPALWLDRIRGCGATVTALHGPMIEMIHRQPRRSNDHDNPLEVLLAAPLPKSIGADFVRRLGVTVVEVWA